MTSDRERSEPNDRERSEPAVDEVVQQVDQDVFRVTIPVPFQGLRHVHGYLLRGADGWDLVDTGLATPEALAAWQVASEHVGLTPGNLRQIILTHHHPDHLGLAGRLQQAARQARGEAVPVWLSPREIEIVGIVWGDRRGRDAVMEAYFGRCGVPDPADVNFSAREIEGLKSALLPFPHFMPIEPDTEVGIGSRVFRALLTPGHSDGHLVFFDPVDGLLLVGDHVLPHITPNIARWPGVEEDPLGRYLASLDGLQALAVRCALPGHGDVIAHWPERLAVLRRHHQERLDAMRHAVGPGATVYDVTRRVFARRTLDRHQFRMALAETLAHLEHLAYRNRLRRHADDAWWFEPA